MSVSSFMTHAQIFDELYGGVTKRTVHGGEREITPILSAPRPAAEYLYHTVRELRPTTSLEIGMAWGFSSVAICSALRDNGGGVNVIVDPYQTCHFEGVGIAALDTFGLASLAEVHEQRSDLFLPTFWQGRKNRIQFAFIDGDHRVDAVFVDFYYVDKLLDEGGIVVFDDHQFPSVRDVVKYAVKNFHYETVACDEARFAVIRKVKLDDRGWEAYGEL